MVALGEAPNARADAAHALRLQVEMAAGASSNAALDAEHARAGIATELVVSVPYVLRTETREVSIGSRASGRRHSDDRIDRTRDVGVDVAWVERLQGTTLSARAQASRRALDDRLDAGTGAVDGQRSRDETDASVQLTRALSPTATLQASAAGSRVRHERARNGDALVDYELTTLRLRYQRALAAGGMDDRPAQSVAFDVDATRYSPEGSLPRTRTAGVTASWRWRPTEHLAIAAYAGADYRQLDGKAGAGGRGTGDTTSAFGASARYDGERFSLGVDLARALQPSALGTLTRNTTFTVDARYQQSPTRHAYTTASWTRIAALDGAADLTLDRRLRDVEGDTFSMRAGMHWQGTPELAFDVSCGIARNDRGTAAASRSAAQDHRLEVAVAYTPKALRW